VQTIYHAAAYKHVPMVEKNPSEAVWNNIFGTLRTAQASLNASVETFVLISTDKAVRPTNTMGATKRFAELILQALSQDTNNQRRTRFTMVRFGNVLGSSGSVVPLFREQIARNGPITVTDPRIIRYFMTIPEAAQLVIQAGAMGQGGDVFVLDMGEPIRILDLAKRMIHLSGLEIKDADHPEGEIEIRFTGLRPGEKLYEELLIGDNVSKTGHSRIMRAEEHVLPWYQLEKMLSALQCAVESDDCESVRDILKSAVSGFAPQCEIADVLWMQQRVR
jgi:FlaA1/EpsC-like NDP-sugar epimerase